MIQMYFGKACKEYREEMNISQEKFALSIGMDRTYYSSVEAGKRNVSIQNIKKIADGFGISISELMKKAEMYMNKERPIHALGCGGYPNIVSNYFCGATSFDAATPARRVCDGNKDSAALVHTKIHYKKGKPGFSQYFIGGFNVDGSQRKENPDYINLNEVPDDMEMCGCPACQSAESILNIKNIYAKKVNDDKEAFFYSRQLMGLHAVFQHKLLCEKVAEYDDLESFCSKYSNDLNDGILKVYKQL